MCQEHGHDKYEDKVGGILGSITKHKKNTRTILCGICESDMESWKYLSFLMLYNSNTACFFHLQFIYLAPRNTNQQLRVLELY